MKDRAKLRHAQRLSRHSRVRKRVSGTPDRPRLSVFRSNQHISAQIVDDLNGKTLCSISSTAKDVQKTLEGVEGNVEKSRRVGRMLAEMAKEVGVSKVVFDRGGNRYHGRVKALAEGARENDMLEF